MFSLLIKKFKNKKTNKGFTIVEILVVLLILSIIIGLSANQYNKHVNLNKINTVENELSGWMSDINQYIEDYGSFKVDIADVGITSKDEYLAYLYYGDIEESASSITNESYEFYPNSPLGILSTYFTISTMIDDVNADVKYIDENNHYIILTTRTKKDPWESKYKVILDTKSGNAIVYSTGPDNADESATYKNGNFGDDIVLAIKPK